MAPAPGMASLSDYQLYWSDAGRPTADPADPNEQYVFATRADLPASLRRVRSVEDLLGLLSGGRKSADGFAVAGVALLYGNLVATGRWLCLLGFVATGLLVAVLEMRATAAAAAAALTGLLLSTLWAGLSLHWLAAVGVQVLLALALLVSIAHAVQEDPRGHALLREACGGQRPGLGREKRAGLEERPREEDSAGPSSADGSAVVIRNDCCMDVKLLIFDGSDVVRMVPRGGLLGGTLVVRGASHCVGSEPPYVVKAYAPWETELGTFLVPGGSYSFRATAPPLALLPSASSRFTNRTEARVRLCACGADCWSCSLWLPLAPLLARLRWGTRAVEPGQDVPLRGPCVVRVFGAGLCGALLQSASCRVRDGERAEYLGPLRWTSGRAKVARSCSTLFDSIS